MRRCAKRGAERAQIGGAKEIFEEHLGLRAKTEEIAKRRIVGGNKIEIEKGLKAEREEKRGRLTINRFRDKEDLKVGVVKNQGVDGIDD